MSPTFTTAIPHNRLPTPAIHLLYPTYSSGLNTRKRSVLVGRAGGFDAGLGPAGTAGASGSGSRDFANSLFGPRSLGAE